MSGRPDHLRTPIAGPMVASLMVLLAAVPVMAADPSPVAPSTVSTPHFVKDKRTGIDQTYDGDQFYVGGGVASFDCDGDGRPDLYLAGGDNPAGLFHNESAVGGALRFARLTDPVTDLTSVTGAYPIDIDGDGNIDLAVLRLGEDVLLRGHGDCTFERANETWGFAGGDAWTTAFSATWEGDATLPTLATGGYLDTSDSVTVDDMCLDDQLYRPAPVGTGYSAPLPLSPSYCTLSMLFSDWDRSGRRDLRVTNDQHYYRVGSDQLWKIVPDKAPEQYGKADGWQRLRINGMGIASYDVTGDGYPEYYLTSQADNKLQTLTNGPSRPEFTDMAGDRGVTAYRPFTGGDTQPSTAWHAEFQDVNNDGLIDLFISKGNIGGVPDYAAKDPSDLMLGTADGTFVERAKQAGVLSYKLGRGAALVDLNLDGLLDLVQVERGSPVQVWRNVGSGPARDAKQPAKQMGHWAGIQVEQPGPNRDAIGAWVEVRTGDQVQRRELTIGGGHAGGQLGPIHVGLGDATSADARVQWPDGEWGEWTPLAVDQYQTIKRGAATTVPMQLPR